LNGEALIEAQLQERREKLYASFKEVKGEFEFAKTITSRELDEMQQFLNDSVDHRCVRTCFRPLCPPRCSFLGALPVSVVDFDA
jgi:hypothetical protein